MKIISKLGAYACLIVGISAAHSSVYTPNFNNFGFPDTQFGVDAIAISFPNTNDGVALQNAVPNTPERIDFFGTNDLAIINHLGILSTPVGLFPNGDSQFDSSLITYGRWQHARGGLISDITAKASAGNDVAGSLTYDNDRRRGSVKADTSSEADPSKLAMLGLGLFGFAVVRCAKRKPAK